MLILLQLFWSTSALSSADVDPFSPIGSSVNNNTCELCLSVGHISGIVPLFSAATRDESYLELSGSWSLYESIEVRMASNLQNVSWPNGDSASGPGDIRLGTSWRLLGAETSSLWLDWSAKMPNAQDTTRLGTDETDVTIGTYGQWSNNYLNVVAGGELQVLGDPLQYANQDDIFLVGAAVETALESLHFRGRLIARLESPRNPLDLRVGLGVKLKKGNWGYGINSTAGLSPAAGDYSLSASIHRIWACPTLNGD